ncbi:MAG: hypothetical protein A2140_07545 [Candidatus Muproteobacteria bacterium RBG_16_62_13]|uniref:Uncharacterized protein n=1 Tax=Candidatus Muproteobacteria bacterium RBG_16_62_13 TaxID=1817756 RepID=A0A1F6T8J3_9PROT|nr:MAG: hypothetical protein A2140_07545 [Candidatus Muproteobacteria bacterium RBG_16_62_13]
MTNSEFIDLIRAKNLYPIRIEGEAEKEEFSGDIFIGTLEDYFLAVKALNATTIFIISSSLSDDDFIYASESEFEDPDELSCEYDEDVEDEADVDELDDEVDLTVALPSLSEFKKFLAKEYAFILIAKGGSSELSYYHEENWWRSFEAQREEAIEKVDEDREAVLNKMRKKMKEDEKERTKLVRALIHDSEFVHIPTQRGMRAYAIEKHPELEEMDDAVLTEEIQLLSDKIKTKGLNRRR